MSTIVPNTPVINNNEEPVNLLKNKTTVDDSTRVISTTLSSLETPVSKIEHLFDQTVKQAETTKPSSVDIKALKLKQARELRKAQKKGAKEERVTKSSSRTQIDVVIPTVISISGKAILDLRFSQDSIKSETQDGIQLKELIQNIKTEGWRKGTTITVIKMPDGALVSMDNRRLLAAQEVAKENPNFKLPITVFKHDDDAPKKMLAGVIEEYKKGRGLDNIDQLAEEIIPNTYGHCASLRIHTRQGKLDSGNFGYAQTPVVRS